MEGVITSWMADRGFGWVDVGDEERAFLHINDTDLPDKSQPLRPGMRVACEIIETSKGPRCISARVLG